MAICPGGEVEVCIGVCPGTTARVYGACVQVPKANSDTETKPSENNLTVFVDALCSGPVLFQDSFLIPFQCVQPMLNVLQGCADRCAEAERQRRARAFFLQLS